MSKITETLKGAALLAPGAARKVAGLARALERPAEDIARDAGATVLATLVRGGDYQPGDHLKVLYGPYSHQGIYAGDGQVIHLTRAKGFVEKVPLDEFRQGSKRVWVVASPAAYEGREIVRRAESRLGEKGYSLLSGNCEHFCNWARSGEASSRQVNRWTEALGVGPEPLPSEGAQEPSPASVPEKT